MRYAFVYLLGHRIVDRCRCLSRVTCVILLAETHYLTSAAFLYGFDECVRLIYPVETEVPAVGVIVSVGGVAAVIGECVICVCGEVIKCLVHINNRLAHILRGEVHIVRAYLFAGDARKFRQLYSVFACRGKFVAHRHGHVSCAVECRGCRNLCAALSAVHLDLRRKGSVCHLLGEFYTYLCVLGRIAARGAECIKACVRGICPHYIVKIECRCAGLCKFIAELHARAEA